MQVYDAALTDGEGEPGCVVSIDGNGVTVQASGGRILIKRVRPAGGGKIPAIDWARQSSLSPGASLNN